jgi:hypothetical protein
MMGLSGMLAALAVCLCRLSASGQEVIDNDPKTGLAEWTLIESVLTHPRCLNCHTMTGYPRQGDAREPHAPEVVGGSDGHGGEAKCQTCHSNDNQAATGLPGASDWHMPPPALAWEGEPGKPAPGSAICATLTRDGKDGSPDFERLIEYVQLAPVVLWAWEPGKRGDGTERQTPPLRHAAFVDALKRWISAGAPCPPGTPASER